MTCFFMGRYGASWVIIRPAEGAAEDVRLRFCMGQAVGWSEGETSPFELFFIYLRNIIIFERGD